MQIRKRNTCSAYMRPQKRSQENMQSALGNNMVNVVASLDHAQGRKEKSGKGIGDK
jgi:hypothetical protein